MKKNNYFGLSVLISLALFFIGIREAQADFGIGIGCDMSKRDIKLEDSSKPRLNPSLAFLELSIGSKKFSLSLLGGMTLTNLDDYVLYDQIPISIETNFSDNKAIAFGGEVRFHIAQISVVKIGALAQIIYYSHYSNKPNEWKIEELAEKVTNKEEISYIRVIGGPKFSYDFKNASFYLAPVYSNSLNGKLKVEQNAENILEKEKEEKSFEGKTLFGLLSGIEVGRKLRLKCEFRLLSETGLLMSFCYRF